MFYLNEKNKKAVLDCYIKFTELGFLPASYHIFYNTLCYYGAIKNTKSEVKLAYAYAQEKLIAKAKGTAKPYIYNGKSNLMVIFNAKTLLLEDYFKKIDSENKNLETILNDLKK